MTHEKAADQSANLTRLYSDALKATVDIAHADERRYQVARYAKARLPIGVTLRDFVECLNRRKEST